MRLEFFFSFAFVFALGVAYLLKPQDYAKSSQEQRVEVEFSAFILTQWDKEGFKSKVAGSSGEKYPEVLLIDALEARDREGNKVTSKRGKMFDNAIYLDEDVIITTDRGGVLTTQSAKYDMEKEQFRSLRPFKATYGEHVFYGDNLVYEQNTIRSTDVRAILKEKE